VVDTSFHADRCAIPADAYGIAVPAR